MDTIFLNSENSKTPEPHVVILRLANNMHISRRYISPEERKQIIEELRLVPKNERLLMN